jgi:hypothetical protein
MLFRMRRLQGDCDFPQTKQVAVVDSLDINLAYTAIRIRPETFCYLLRVIARPPCAFWRSRCPPWSQGCSARPPIAAGVWYKHLDGGFPVQGVRFGGLKSAQFHLPQVAPSSPRTAYHRITWLMANG